MQKGRLGQSSVQSNPRLDAILRYLASDYWRLSRSYVFG